MPGLDGFEFCRYVRQDDRFKHVPVVAMTGLQSDTEQKKMKDVGVDGFLFKPFTKEQLVEIVDRFKSAKASKR